MQTDPRQFVDSAALACHGSMKRSNRAGLYAALTALVAGSVCAADEPDAAGTFQEYARQEAAAYEIRITDDAQERPASLVEQPLLRWTNPIRAREAHGDVFLWTAGGRPAAVLSLYQWTGPDGNVHEHHEFCSLAEVGLSAVKPNGKNSAKT